MAAGRPLRPFFLVTALLPGRYIPQPFISTLPVRPLVATHFPVRTIARLLALTVGIALSIGGVVVLAPSAEAVSDSSKTKFIASLVSAAQKTQHKFGLPASVSIAQAIEASGWGTSAVVKEANNYFDTPCGGSMTATQYSDLADAQLGKPYVLGANGPKQFDCSSLVIWLNSQSGAFRMGDDTAAGLYNRSRAVAGSPAVGDMVFLRNNPARSNGIGHMAVLTKKLSGGDWRIIEARGRAYGVVPSTLSYWKQRSYYAGLRRLATITFANSKGITASAARLYQAGGCVTIGSTRYARFTSVTASFFGHAAAVVNDSAYKAVRAVIKSVPKYVDAIAKVEHPSGAASHATTINNLISTYNLTRFDVVPLDLVLLSGDEGAKVTALQYLLPAGTSVNVTGTFDPATVSAVKKYQAAKKLDPDGEAGPQTLNSLFTSLSPGATGPKVRALHALLSAVGQPTTAGDTFGKETVASLKAIQSMAGHSPTGVANANTWTLLFSTPDQAPAPALTGTARVNQALSAVAGKWEPGSFTLTYQWHRAGRPIPGATEATYRLQPDDAGAEIAVAVTGTRPGYTTVTRTSAPLLPSQGPK